MSADNNIGEVNQEDNDFEEEFKLQIRKPSKHQK
jgi:hypothetical protein